MSKFSIKTKHEDYKPPSKFWNAGDNKNVLHLFACRNNPKKMNGDIFNSGENKNYVTSDVVVVFPENEPPRAYLNVDVVATWIMDALLKGVDELHAGILVKKEKATGGPWGFDPPSTEDLAKIEEWVDEYLEGDFKQGFSVKGMQADTNDDDMGLKKQIPISKSTADPAFSLDDDDFDDDVFADDGHEEKNDSKNEMPTDFEGLRTFMAKHGLDSGDISAAREELNDKQPDGVTVAQGNPKEWSSEDIAAVAREALPG